MTTSQVRPHTAITKSRRQQWNHAVSQTKSVTTAVWPRSHKTNKCWSKAFQHYRLGKTYSKTYSKTYIIHNIIVLTGKAMMSPLVTARKNSFITSSDREALQQIYNIYQCWSEGVKGWFVVGVVGFLELLRDAREKKRRKTATYSYLCPVSHTHLSQTRLCEKKIVSKSRNFRKKPTTPTSCRKKCPSTCGYRCCRFVVGLHIRLFLHIAKTHSGLHQQRLNTVQVIDVGFAVSRP